MAVVCRLESSARRRIYIYIYICLCVCVCVCVSISVIISRLVFLALVPAVLAFIGPTGAIHSRQSAKRPRDENGFYFYLAAALGRVSSREIHSRILKLSSKRCRNDNKAIRRWAPVAKSHNLHSPFVCDDKMASFPPRGQRRCYGYWVTVCR